jgi:hypothetical protein
MNRRREQQTKRTMWFSGQNVSILYGRGRKDIFHECFVLKRLPTLLGLSLSAGSDSVTDFLKAPEHLISLLF